MDALSDIEAQLLAMSRPDAEASLKSSDGEVSNIPDSDEKVESSPKSSAKKSGQPLSRILMRTLNLTSNPIVVYTPELLVEWANPAARMAWPVLFKAFDEGKPFREAVLTQTRSLYPGHTEAEYMQTVAEVEAAHRSSEDIEIFTSKGRWIRLSHNAIGSDYIFFVGVDITEQKALSEELIEARKTAEEAQEASASFLARMSHEINTPLNAIIGMSDALLEDDDITADTRETMDFILTAADGLSHLLGQTLDHARLMSGQIKVEYHENSPADLVRKVAGMWNAKCAAKGVELRIRTNPNTEDEIFFDRYRYQQILNNLLSNAVKFTTDGDITVVLKMVDGPGNTRRLALAVKDTGIGMDAEATSRIFNAYEQAAIDTQRQYGGTGLGLNIVKSLTEAMDGTITVKSTPGEGTTFIAVIPAYDQIPDVKIDAETDAQSQAVAAKTQADKSKAVIEPTSPKPKAEPTITKPAIDEKPETPFSGLNVLCVEDNMVNQAVVKKLIGRQVHSISFAQDGKVALEILALQKFDVVLMDIHMPNMNGIEATQKIRSSKKPWANVCIIALTADPDFQYAKVCRNIGMNDSIGKPVKRQDILDAIGRTLDSLKDEHAQKIELPTEDAA